MAASDPARRVMPALPRRPAAPPPAGGDAAAVEQPWRGTILVVDDDERLVRVVCMYLAIEGYRVLSAAGGVAALTALTSERVDLIIMDIMMPGMDGIEVCVRIRADAQTAHIPVLLFSALSSTVDAERARQAGANHLITKPFNLVGLADIVNSYHRDRSAPIQP